MTPLEKLRNEIMKRINDLEKSDEEHMNNIMDCELKIDELNRKREKLGAHLKQAREELREIDQFVEWKKELEF